MPRPTSSNRAIEQLRWLLLALLLLIYYYGGALGFNISLPFRGSSGSSSLSSQMSIISFTSSQSSVVSSEEESLLDDINSDDDDDDDEYQYVFWLMPTASDTQLLQDTIMNELRDEFDAVFFEPHVTLAPPIPASNIPDPEQALERLTTTSNISNKKTSNLRGTKNNEDVLTLSGAHANYGTLYTQSVFLQLQATPQLKDLYNRSRKVSGLPPVQEIPADDHFPHLSVLYESCCEQERETVASHVQHKLQQTSLAQHISFDAVQLIRIQLPVEGPADVRKWKVVGSAKLR